MPIIDTIFDTDGNLVPEAPVILFSEMLYPDQPGVRRDFVLGGIIDSCIANGVLFSPQVMALARTLPSRGQAKATADERFETGLAVGHIYNDILALGHAGLAARASFNTVATVASIRLQNKGVASKRTLQEWWDMMVSVRHLWAAWVARGRLIHKLEYLETEDGDAAHTAEADLGCFLVEAEQAFRAGALHRSSRSRPDMRALAGADFSLITPETWPRPRPIGPFGTYIIPRPNRDLLDEIARLTKAESSQPHRPRSSR